MNKKFLTSFLRLVLLSSLSCGSWLACSNQWRDGKMKVNSRQVSQYAVEGMQSLSQFNVSDGNQFADFYNDPNSRVYFTYGGAGSELGSVEAVAPIYSWSFMGSELGELSVQANTGTQITQIRIFLVEKAVGGSSFEFALLVHAFTASGSITRSFFSGPVTISEENIALNLTSSQGNSLTVGTVDVTSDLMLADVIQLEVYLSGDYVGKIATLMIP